MPNQRPVVVVTGGSKGIGKAIGKKFLAQGFDIITCARTTADLEKLQNECKGEFPDAKVSVFSADISKMEELERFVDFIKSVTPTVDVLVNNAGYYAPGQITNEPEGQLEHMFSAHVLSAYHLTRAVLPLVPTQGKSHIFTMCSVASIVPYVNGGSYCITKFALLGFSKVLREELKPKGIRVTSILPGATLTDSWAGAPFPPERFMPVEDIAEAVWGAYALSERTVIEELVVRPQLGDI